MEELSLGVLAAIKKLEQFLLNNSYILSLQGRVTDND